MPCLGCSDEEISDKEVTDKHLTSIARGQVNPDWDIFGDGEPGSLEMNMIEMGNMKQVSRDIIGLFLAVGMTNTWHSPLLQFFWWDY